MLKTLHLVCGIAFAFIAFESRTMAEEVELDTKDVKAGQTPVGGLINVPIKRQEVAPGIFFVSGLANVYLVNTSAGAVVIDTGFAHQAPAQMKLLKEVLTGPVKYIFLPQGQADDIAGIPLIRDKDTQIIMTRNSMEYMVHRKKASAFLLPRYAALYSWTNELRAKGSEKKKKQNPYPYNPITPDILVEDSMGYRFTLGGTEFEVISLPGAEGINSAGLWMPKEKILFTGGGSVGPDFPMWPNLGTVRSDRNRILTKYIDTINKIIDLKPAMLLTGQNEIFTDASDIMTKLVLLRDASQYVHDEIWAGLSAGKDVYELMREIKLPKEMAHLSQQHGRVEWTVRETVNQTGAWFGYRYTSELYPYRAHEVFSELVNLASADNVLKEAEKQLAEGKLEQALLLVEAVQEANAENQAAFKVQLKVLQALLKRAQTTHNTFSEVAWLQGQIRKTKEKLAH